MASIEAALVAAVLAEPTIAAVIGDRFFSPGGRQGAQYPYATYQRISTVGTEYLDEPADVEWPRFQIDVWSQDDLEALTIAEAVIRPFLESVERTGAGLTFTATFKDQHGLERDEVTRNWRVSQDYSLNYERS